jgi:hypothetical protein
MRLEDCNAACACTVGCEGAVLRERFFASPSCRELGPRLLRSRGQHLSSLDSCKYCYTLHSCCLWRGYSCCSCSSTAVHWSYMQLPHGHCSSRTSSLLNLRVLGVLQSSCLPEQ